MKWPGAHWSLLLLADEDLARFFEPELHLGAYKCYVLARLFLLDARLCEKREELIEAERRYDNALALLLSCHVRLEEEMRGEAKAAIEEIFGHVQPHSAKTAAKSMDRSS